jgi:hypothetical protein
MDIADYKTPQELEQYYCSYLENDIEFRYKLLEAVRTTQNYGPNKNYNLLQELKKHLSHLDEYNKIEKWFLERFLVRFSNILNSYKSDLNEAIKTQNQTYQSSIVAQQAENQIFINHNNDILEIYRKMNADRQSAYQASNEAWNSYFSSKTEEDQK